MLGISVVIPTYNRAHVISRAVGSVLAQTYPATEIIVVDDGSTDDTERVVASLQRSHSHINYLRQKQQGAAAARNTGISASKADWIAFLDSDDYWLPEKLELQASAISKFSEVSAVCVSDARYTNNPHLMTTAFQRAGIRSAVQIGTLPDLPRRIVYGFHGIYIQTLVVRRAMIAELGGFDPQFVLSEDSDMLFRLSQKTLFSCVFKPLVDIDRDLERSGGLIELARQERLRLEVYQRLYEKWIASPGLDSGVRGRIALRLQEVHASWASLHLIDGNYDSALSSLSSAGRYCFTSKLIAKWLLTRFSPNLARRIVARRRSSARHLPVLA